MFKNYTFDKVVKDGYGNVLEEEHLRGFKAFVRGTIDHIMYTIEKIKMWW